MQQYPINQQLKLMFSDSISFISANFRQMVSLCLPILFITNIISVILESMQESTADAVFVFYIFSLLVQPIYIGALIQLMSAKARHENPTNAALLSAAFRQWPKLFLMGLIKQVFKIGYILVIPGIWFSVRLSFAEFFIVVFNMNAADAFKKSMDATKPYALIILFIFLLTYIPLFFITFIMNVELIQSTPNIVFGVIFRVVFTFLQLLIMVVIFRVFMEWINKDQATVEITT